MKDPKRLSEDAPSSFERMLLSSGKGEPPPDDLEQRVLAAFAALPAAAPSKPSFFGSLRPYHLVIALVAASAVVGTVTLNRSPAPVVTQTTPAPVVTQTAAPMPIEAPPGDNLPVVTPDSLPTAPEPVKPSVRVPSSAPVAVQGSSLDREVALLEIVKAKLGAHDAAEATRNLDVYNSEFPQGALRPEATVLRVQTLLMQGNRPAAQALADEYLGQHPSSVHATRIRALLAD